MSNGQLIGCMRASTADQNAARQLDGMTLDKVFTDHASGKDTKRPQLAACLDYVREGDTLVVHSMDRLARSLRDLLQIVDDLTERGVAVRFAKENITFTADESDPCAVLMMQVMGAVAQFERSLILERQREGIAIARADGKYTGRKPSLSDAQAQQVLERLTAGESAAALAREFGVNRSTIYNTRSRAVARVGDRARFRAF
ncbi:recombinase family protein [Gordonia sp. zg691]|uniref:recombinase family protein n=1 Tax=Gordonia jinghuaiqii TaxID=2758710 RepID=UPI0016624C48|nr:recombinase family protein [Gordonia jinghuaiqii]MBD0861330.1 recombinase family protein [Gordonia jinghuaiqii]